MAGSTGPGPGWFGHPPHRFCHAREGVAIISATARQGCDRQVPGKGMRAIRRLPGGYSSPEGVLHGVADGPGGVSALAWAAPWSGALIFRVLGAGLERSCPGQSPVGAVAGAGAVACDVAVAGDVARARSGSRRSKRHSAPDGVDCAISRRVAINGFRSERGQVVPACRCRPARNLAVPEPEPEPEPEPVGEVDRLRQQRGGDCEGMKINGTARHRPG
jgi:hypothetical protein